MFHRTHAGAYVHFSRILPHDEKTSKKWPFFGQKLSFLASDKRLKTIFVPKSAKKGSFLVKNLIFFAFSQAVEDFLPCVLPSFPGVPVSPLPGQCINSQPWLRALTHCVAPLMRGRPGRRRRRARATGLSPVGPPWAGAEAA